MLSHIGPVVIIVALLIVGSSIRTFVRNASRAVVAVLADPGDPDVDVQSLWLEQARSQARVFSREVVPTARDDEADAPTATLVRDERVAETSATRGEPRAPLAARAPLPARSPLPVRPIVAPQATLVARAARSPLSPHQPTAPRSHAWH